MLITDIIGGRDLKRKFYSSVETRHIGVRRVKANSGFSGRRFLTKTEWATYLKRMPVRYIKGHHEAVCYVCKKAGTTDNPLQHAHIIGFKVGIVELGLTPEWLDGPDNIVSAHRKTCNNVAELSIADSMERLRRRGLKKIPSHLPDYVQRLWAACCREFSEPCVR